MDGALAERVKTVLLMLLEATQMEGVKAWAMQIAFRYAIEFDPTVNKRDVWKLIEGIYEENIRQVFPQQRDPAQSFKRVSGDAFEMFIYEYLNANRVLQREGIRAVRLKGRDFQRLMSRLGLPLRPKDIDLFLQGIGEDGIPRIFGALFPKVSYAERIRADEPASRALMNKDLWSATITLDAREELGTEERPSVKRETINRGAFDSCYSLNSNTSSGPRIHVVDLRQKGITTNPLIGDIVHAWRQFQRVQA